MSVAGINGKLFSAFVEINENVIDKINVVIKTVTNHFRPEFSLSLFALSIFVQSLLIYIILDGKKLKFWKAKLMSEQELLTTFPELKEYEYKLNELEAGTILFTNPKQGLFIKAKQGILQILEIQAENAKRMSTSDFLRGNNIQAGSILE